MNSRERVLTALKHKEPDEVPLDLGGTESSGMTANAWVKFMEYLNSSEIPRIFEPMQYVAYIPEKIANMFGVDTLNLTPEPKEWIKSTNPHGFDVFLPAQWKEQEIEDGSTIIKNKDGKVIAKRPKGGIYFDSINPVMQNIDVEQDLGPYRNVIENFDWPSFADEGIDALKSRAKHMHEQDKCVVFNLCCHLLAAAQIMRGFENAMMDMIVSPDFFNRLMEMLLEAYCRRIDTLAPSLKPYVDVVLLNDDLGFQNGPMLAPDHYRTMIKPFQKKLFAKAKQAFDAPLLFHSCGSVREFIPDFIEIGVDAINPVQVSAKGMDLVELKREFGKDLTFWGGGIDTQNILNRNTPEQVSDEIKRTLDVMASGGGFIFTQVHNIQPDVPPENVHSMLTALQKHRNY